MYIIASQWKFGGPDQAQHGIALFRSSFGALIAAQPGLRAWYLVATAADEALTISGWDDQVAHATAQPLLAAWVQENLAGLDAHVQLRRRGDTVAQVGPEAAGYSSGGGSCS